MSALRPRDFIESDGLLAAVTSVVHAEGPVVTPRYVRERGHLRKLDTVGGRAYVLERHPEWLLTSPLLGAEIILVPGTRIERVYRPAARAAELRATGDGSPVERRAAGVVSALVRHDVPDDRIGLTGSVLVGAAGRSSDIDVVVYGRAAFAAARAALGRLVASGEWREPDETDWHEAWARRGSPGTFEEYHRHERRKGTKAIVEGTRLDLSLLQDEGEGTPERPPYRKLGRLTIEAPVTDASAAFDLPARYAVRHALVSEVVSWTATYAGQALVGEWVHACGWLEEDAAGGRRLLLGTSREAEGEWLVVREGAA